KFIYPKPAIPSVQYIEYHFSKTRAVVNGDFDVVRRGHEVQNQAEGNKLISCELPNGMVIATIDGDVARLPDGKEVKLENNKVPEQPKIQGDGNDRRV